MGIIGAAVIGGVATVGSAAIAADAQAGSKGTPSPNLFNPHLTTTYGGSSALLAAQMGLPFGPQLQVAGPFQSAMQAWQAQGWGGSHGAKRMREYARDINQIYQDYRNFLRGGIPAQFGVTGYIPPEAVANMSVRDVIRLAPRHWGIGGRHSTRPVKELETLAAISGWGSFDHLFKAQIQYKKDTEESLVAMGVARDAANEMIQRSAEIRRDIMENMPGASAADIETVRQAELDRMEAEFDRADRNLLRAAQAGGFNPGRGLEESARLRSTGQNEALSRALSLISAEQAASAQQLDLVNALDPSKQFLPMVPDMTRAGLPHQIHAGQPPGNPGVNPWARATENIGNIVGESILAYNQQQAADRRHAETLAAMNSPAYEGPP